MIPRIDNTQRTYYTIIPCETQRRYAGKINHFSNKHTTKGFPVKIIKKSIILLITLLIFGCAQYGGYQPTVDTYGDRNAMNIGRDMQDCKQLSEQASGGGVTQGAMGAGVGALIGAAGGAALGAVIGNPATGAMIGGAAGGIGGAAKQGLESNSDFKRAYANCMRNRGHNIVN